MPSNLCPKNCLATCVYDAKPGALPGLLNRALKESYSEEKACKNRNVLEGWSFKTALFQQPVNLRSGVSSYLTARHPAAGYYSFGQLNELACPWFFAVKRVSRKEGTDQGPCVSAAKICSWSSGGRRDRADRKTRLHQRSVRTINETAGPAARAHVIVHPLRTWPHLQDGRVGWLAHGYSGLVSPSTGFREEVFVGEARAKLNKRKGAAPICCPLLLNRNL